MSVLGSHQVNPNGSICAAIMFSVSFLIDGCLFDGRWYSETIFGRPDVANSYATVRRWRTASSDTSETVCATEHSQPTIDKLPGYWRMRQETWARSFKDDNPKARAFSCIVVSQNGIGSMPRRCQECVNDKGGHTSYWLTNVLTKNYKLTMQILGKFC